MKFLMIFLISNFDHFCTRTCLDCLLWFGEGFISIRILYQVKNHVLYQVVEKSPWNDKIRCFTLYTCIRHVYIYIYIYTWSRCHNLTEHFKSTILVKHFLLWPLNFWLQIQFCTLLTKEMLPNIFGQKHLGYKRPVVSAKLCTVSSQTYICLARLFWISFSNFFPNFSIVVEYDFTMAGIESWLKPRKVFRSPCTSESFPKKVNDYSASYKLSSNLKTG